MSASIRDRRRGMAFQMAMLVAIFAQLVVAFIAPAADARAERGGQSHVEIPGSHRHIAHVDALCPSCAAQNLLAHPASGSSGAAADIAIQRPLPALARVRGTFLLWETSAPRAPPLLALTA